ncbi:MAG: sulfur carrier protein ThiS [Verrucomicrobiales bacterium]|jgi:thiamine biosynthesis protein ThiS|nr:sulfur carrier protein ThiS [Verrucomicrobiales bacterium]
MNITVNGETRECPAGTKLSDLLQAAGLDPKAILVELNELVLQRHEYPLTVLKDGDRLEFLRVVAGG